MKRRAEAISLTALLLALVAVTAAILFFLDAREEIHALRQTHLEATRHFHPVDDAAAAHEEVAGQIRELDAQVAGIRRDLLTLAQKTTEDRAAQARLADQLKEQARTMAGLEPGQPPRDPSVDPLPDLTGVRDTLREHAVLIAALRADLGILSKRVDRSGTLPPSPDTTPGFDPSLRALDPLQRESDALQKRIEALQATLEEGERLAGVVTHADLMRRMEALELLLLESTAPVGEPKTTAAVAELEQTVGEILALLARQKEQLATLEDPLQALPDALAPLRSELVKLDTALRAELAVLKQTQEAFNDSSTRQSLALRELIDHIGDQLRDLTTRGGLTQEQEESAAQIALSLARLQDQMQDLRARAAPPAIYHFSAADGTYIVNPHKDFNAILLRKSFAPGRSSPVYTFLRIPFAPQGKRISPDALAADDSIGGIRALNAELVPLAQARSLPYGRRLPEIYYYTTDEGTFVLNPHADTSAVLHVSGSYRFLVVPGSMRPQRVGASRLVADGMDGGLSCLNFRLVYFGHNRTFEFE